MQQPPPGSNGGAPLPVVAPLPLLMPVPPPPPLPLRAPSAQQLPPAPLPPPPPPHAGYRPDGGGLGFSSGQLHVLRHQIMAYRAIKVRLMETVIMVDVKGRKKLDAAGRSSFSHLDAEKKNPNKKKRGELPLPPSLLAAVHAPDLVPTGYFSAPPPPPPPQQQLYPSAPPPPAPPLPPPPTVTPLPLPLSQQQQPRPAAAAAAAPAPLPVAAAPAPPPPPPPPPQPPPHPPVKRRDGPLFHAASDPRVTAVPLPQPLPSALPRGCLAPGVAASLLASDLQPALSKAMESARREAERALEAAKAAKDRAAASAAAFRLRGLRLVALQDSLRSRTEGDYCGNAASGAAPSSSFGGPFSSLLHASERRYRKAARELDDLVRESYRARARRRAEAAAEAAAAAKAWKSEVLSERVSAARDARVARNRNVPKLLDRAQRGAAASAATARAAATQAAAAAAAAAAARASGGFESAAAKAAAEAAAAQAQRDAERKARMDALQANDWAKYQQLLRAKRGSGSSASSASGAGPNDQERYAAIDKFLNETDEYLVQLTSKVARAKQDQEAAEARARATGEALREGKTEEEAAEAGEEAARRAAAAAASTAVDAATAAEDRGEGDGEEKKAAGTGGVMASYHALAHAVSEKIDSAPAGLRPPSGAALREYQLVGVQWMVSLYNNKLNGILADEMGLGKTVQVMALIAYLAEKKQNFGPHLIIVPNAVLVNWRAELTQWLPNVRSVYYVGKREDRKVRV